MKLSNPSELKQVIERHGFSFSKSLGQNFLIDQNILDKIVAGSGIDKTWGVLEIGPGAGTLTRELAHAAKNVVAVEIDKSLIPLLEDTLSDLDNVKVISDDVMKVDLKALIEENFKGMPVAVVANLPYYITTPIIMNLLESRLPFKKIVVMIQKEVAERLCASPGGKDYGAISVATQYFSKPQIIKHVPAGAFIPAPKVDSSVVSMEILAAPSVSPKDEKLFFKVIKAAFSQRRKTLVNALSSSGAFGSKEEVAAAVEAVGLSPTVRGEALSIEQFCALSDYFVH